MKEQEPPQHDVFLKYFSNERHRIFRFIFSLVPVNADAEDIFQQTSIVLWKKFGDFDQSREFYPWACRVAFHCVLNFRKSAKRKRMFISDDLVKLIAEDRIGMSQRMRLRHEMLEECIALLPTKDSQLIKEVYTDGIAVADIARRCDRAIQTIYNRLNLIRKRLVDCVDRKMAAD